MKKRTKQLFEELNKALKRLEEAAQEDPGAKRFLIDSTIQRFEFSIELFKKTLSGLLYDEELITTNGPREIFEQAFKIKLIQNEKIWVAMIKDRNKTSHTYHEDLADEIYTRIKTYVPIMQNCFKDLQKRYFK